MRLAFENQHGQVLPWAAFMLLCVLGMGGLVLDVGRAFVTRAQLQNSANAAALAASGEVFNANPESGTTTYADSSAPRQVMPTPIPRWEP